MLLALALVGLGCARKEAPRGLGRRVVEGEVLALRASPDGAWLALLHRCAPVKDRTLPPGTASCDLAVVPAAGGEARRVARGVTTLAPGFAWSATGHALAALDGYDHAEARGALVVWADGEPRRVAGGVSFYALDRAGARAGFVSGGQLFLAPVAGRDAEAVAGAERVTTFEFGGGDGVALLARRAGAAGGDLLAVSGRGTVSVATQVRDYGFAGDGARFAFTAGAAQALAVATPAAPRPAATLGRAVQSFLFSPRGDAIAYVADAAPGRQGDLWVASLPAGAPVRLAQRVGEPRWSGDGSRLAWLQDYDPRSRAGVLGVGGPGLKPASVARNVSDFDLTSDGAWVAYLVHETAGGYSVDLGLARVGGGGKPATVSRGVFGFSFSPDGRWLYYRTACIREAEACDLDKVAVAPQGAKAERVAEGVKSFEYAPGRPDRLLVSWARKDRVALALALWEGGKLTALDTYARPGSAQFLGGDPGRLAWVVVEAKRAGAYVAQVP